MGSPKQQPSDRPSPPQWASKVDSSENVKQQGIELRFNADPSPELQSKLRAVGYRPSKTKHMWYGDNNAANKQFAEKLKVSLPTSLNGPDLFLAPAFEANKTNIEKRDFSFVFITLKNGEVKNYILFEPSKPRAEVIATAFAQQQFGSDFATLAAKPRTHLREARILFNEGKIIYSSEKSPLPFPVPSIHFPEEEEIIEQFQAKGFTSPFSAQEAFDKNLPVIDLAFRYAGPMSYFKEHFEIPLSKQIQNLEQELKNLGGKKGVSEKRNALKEQIDQLKTELIFSEKLIQDENLVFQEDLFALILEKAKQKGYADVIGKELSGFREYVLTNLLDNRAIENYSKAAVQQVVSELIEEYVKDDKNPKDQKKEVSNIDTIKPTQDNKETAQKLIHLPITEPVMNTTEKNDSPLTNESGVYTDETAGEHYEHMVVPMPKGARYKAEIDLVKQEDGSFVKGITSSKDFGDSSYISYSPSQGDVSFSSRTEALRSALKEHIRQLELLIKTPDTIFKNEEKKINYLTVALNSVKAFAKRNNILLDKKIKQNQHELNKDIELLIDRKDSEKSSFSEEEKNYIRKYTGSGGLIKQGATGQGILYEYYTPDSIIKKMWGLAYHFGYDGGAVLEPAVGTGHFLKYAPKTASVVGFEINHYAARIAQILYPTATIYEAYFESIFFTGNIHLKDDFGDTRYSLIIGNPPYGAFSGRYAGMGEKKWTGAHSNEQYFTLRGLDLLKSDGLLIYILPSNFLKGESFANIARKIASKCIGLDRYYLGNNIFKTTDIETDIIALRKI